MATMAGKAHRKRRARYFSSRKISTLVSRQRLVVESHGQVIGDQAEMVGEVGAAVLGHLPARQITGEAVHHRQIELCGQGRDIAHEGHAGVGDHLHAPGSAP